MPQEVVTITVQALTGGTPEPDFGKIAVIGTLGAEGDANVVTEFFSSADVAAAYGDDTDLETAIAAIRAVGVESAYGVMAESTPVAAEVFATGSTGTLAGAGIIAKDSIVASNNAVAKTVIIDLSAETPPTPGAGEIAVNPLSKKWTSAEAATGTGITFAYAHLDVASALAALEFYQHAIILVADLRATTQDYGLLRTLQIYAEANDKMLFFAGANGATPAELQELTTRLTSANVVAVAHQSDSDVGAYAAARASIIAPWSSLIFKDMGGIVQTTFYPQGQVGQPGQLSSFEGGDGSGLGPANVVIVKNGLKVLSNGLTTAGLSSSYAFADVTRTRIYLVDRIKTALTALRLQVEKIPFTEGGIGMVKNAVDGVLTAAINGGALSPASTVVVPKLSQIPQADRANRILRPITFNGVLAGDVHKFGVNLVITV